VVIPEPMREPKPTRTTVTRVLEDLVANADDLREKDTSPLFEDIKAAVRLERGAGRAGPGSETSPDGT
jgi:hypothetical protein